MHPANNGTRRPSVAERGAFPSSRFPAGLPIGASQGIFRPEKREQVSISKARAARAVLAFIVGCVVMASLPGVASAATCPDVEPVSQPFLDQGDDLYYFLAPGGDFERTTGPSWRIEGNWNAAKWLNPFEYAGHRSLVLDGATATSPAVCVDNSRPLLRLGAQILTDYKLPDARLAVAAVRPDG